MKIDRKLNIVIPVYQADGTTIYVHSTPISRMVFEAYFLAISKTFSAIYAEGLGIIAGPRVAALMLKQVATDMGRWEGPAGVQNGLVAEIRRLTNVILPGVRGWECMPYDDAVSRSFLDPDDVAEVENALVFFTVASAMHKRSDLADILNGVLGLWGAQTSSLSCTEYASSLMTPNVAATSGMMVPPSSQGATGTITDASGVTSILSLPS